MLEFLFKIAIKHKRIIKYIISGTTAFSVDILFIYVLTEWFYVWYLLSAVLAFTVAFFVSFYLQKFWTFRDNDRKKIYKQMGLYLIIGLLNLVINTGFMYLLVDVFGIWYLFAQVIMCGSIGLYSFLIYNFLIFNNKKCQEMEK